MFQECRKNKTEVIDWKEIIEGKSNSLAKMKELNWKRKENERTKEPSKREKYSGTIKKREEED